MSSNQEFELRVSEKELVVRECQRIVFGAAEVRPGETVKEQIVKASKNLGKPFGMVRRAWFGLGGPRVLVQLRTAWQAYEAEQRVRAEAELAALHRRLNALEVAIERTRPDTFED